MENNLTEQRPRRKAELTSNGVMMSISSYGVSLDGKGIEEFIKDAFPKNPDNNYSEEVIVDVAIIITELDNSVNVVQGYKFPETVTPVNESETEENESEF